LYLYELKEEKRVHIARKIRFPYIAESLVRERTRERKIEENDNRKKILGEREREKIMEGDRGREREGKREGGRR